MGIPGVIMAGGSGSQLWPLSRANHPKQFLALDSDDTMLQATAKRLECLRIENPGKLPLELIEVQSGAYLGEGDIVRFEDRYGRENSE